MSTFPSFTQVAPALGITPRYAVLETAVLLLDETDMVDKVGFEPTLSTERRILSPLCKPVPSFVHWREIRESNPRIFLGKEMFYH